MPRGFMKKASSFIDLRSEPRVFSWPVRIYHEDTDSGGIVYYANYLKFLERARTEWLRARGFEQNKLAREHGAAFVVRSLSIEYLMPAAFNDELTVTVELEELGAGQIIMAQCIARGADQLVAARVRIACVNTTSFRPVRIPSSLSGLLRGQAAKGKAASRIRDESDIGNPS